MNKLEQIAADFCTELMNDTSAKEYLFRMFNADCRCPQCGKTAPDRFETLNAGKKISCASCGKWYSWNSGTPLAGSKLPPSSQLLLLALLGAGTTDESTAMLTGVSEETVRIWRYKMEMEDDA
ncbi:hypothetical protein [Limisalsivibrio acetivorans]|uniref:hypothetical protein n=1 Tax=Limisalsivibrio acetivorans TaxID=1304888 RepID=UPI0003B6942C|nr:hypothetical protein [Limisalsivibrio acetivorans]